MLLRVHYKNRNYRQFKWSAMWDGKTRYTSQRTIAQPPKCAFRVYLKIVDAMDPVVCKCTEKRKDTTVLLVASGGCELQVNCFVFPFGWVCCIWGGRRRGAWALGFEPCSWRCVTVSSPWGPLGKGGPLRGLFNQSSWQPGALVWRWEGRGVSAKGGQPGGTAAVLILPLG